MNFIKRHKILKNILLIILIVLLRILLLFKSIYKYIKGNNIKIFLIIFLTIFIVETKVYNYYFTKSLKYNISVETKGYLVGPIDTFNIIKSVKQKEESFKEDIKSINNIFELSSISVDQEDIKYDYQTYSEYKKLLEDNATRVNDFYVNLKYLLNTYSNYDVDSIKLKNLNSENIVDNIDLINDVNQDIKSYFNEENLKNILDNIISDLDISYYYLNPKNNKEFKFNEHEFFVAASTVKVGISTMVSDLIKEGFLNESTLEYYNKVDFEGGTGIIQNDPVYTQYSIKYLLEVMIKYSDNIATNILIRVANEIKGDDYYEKYMEKITEGDFDINDNLITAYGAMQTIKNLYNNQDSNKYYKSTIKNMTQTEFNDRMSLYLDDSIIAHKIGGKEHYFNDIGIVLTKEPYLFTSYCSEGYDVCNEAIGSLNLAFYYYHIFENIEKKQ